MYADKRRFGFLLLLYASLTACTNYIPIAEREVERFRADIDNGRESEIYARASSQLKASVDANRFVAHLRELRSKTGYLVSSARIRGWQSMTPSQRTVTLEYRSAFKSGSGYERFVFSTQGGKVELLEYQLQSKALLSR